MDYLGHDLVVNPGGSVSTHLTAPALQFAAIDDFVVALAGGRGNTNRTIIPPAGWTQIDQDWRVNGNGGLSGAFWKVVDAAARDGGEVWSLNSFEEWGVDFLQFSGVQSDDPIVAYSEFISGSNPASGTPITVPSIDATDDTGMLVWYGVIARGGSWSGYPAGLIEVFDHTTGGSGGSTTGTVAGAYEIYSAGAGPTGTRTVTQGSGLAVPVIARLIALRNAVDDGTRFLFDSVSPTDSVLRITTLDRHLADPSRSLITFTDAFSAALGSAYTEVEGIQVAGGVLIGDDPVFPSRATLNLTIAPPAEIRFDFRTADTGDSAAEVSIGGGRVSVEAIGGADVSVYVDSDRSEVAAVPHIANTLYHVKAQVGVLVGDPVWAKIWKDGDPEPGSPQADFTLSVAAQEGMFSEIWLIGDGTELDNLYISGYTGDFVTATKTLFRALSDSVTISDSVSHFLPVPNEYFFALEDTVAVSDHFNATVDHNYEVQPPTEPRTPAVSFVIDGVEMWPVVDFRRTRLTTYANGNPGPGEVWVRDLDREYSFPTGAEVEVRFRGVPVWGGFVMAVKREYVFGTGKGGGLEPRYLVLEVVDYNILFRKRVYYDPADPTNMMVRQWPNGTYDDTVLSEALSKYLDLDNDGLSFDIHRVGTPALATDSCNPDAPDKFGIGSGGWLWEQVMTAVASQTGAVWYIDPEKVVRYVDNSTRQSRFGLTGLSDSPDGVTTAGYRELEISRDGAGLVNEQYTWGMGQGSASPVLGHEKDEASVGAHGLWQAAEIRYDMYCQTSVDRRAETWVQGSPQNRRGGKDDKVSLRCTVFNPYFRVGDVISFVNQTFGFSDDMPVRGAEITFPTPFDIKMVLTIGHTVDAPWNTHEFLFPDIGLPDFPLPVFPGLPVLPPFCLCCGWLPEGTPVEGDAIISSCTPAVTVFLDLLWTFDNGINTFDTTNTYNWSGLANSTTSDAFSTPTGRVPGTASASTDVLPVSPGQIVRVGLQGSRNSLSAWGGSPPALRRKRYFVKWSGGAGGSALIGETWTNRFNFGSVYNELVAPAGVTGFRITAENQQYIDNVSVSVVEYDDADCPAGVNGTFLEPPEPATQILQLYAEDGTLLELGVDYELNPLNPFIILPITTWWLDGDVRIVYIPVHVPHPCDAMPEPDFTIGPPGAGDTIGDSPTEGDPDVDGTFFHLSSQFVPNSTQVWVDGLRIRLGYDYVEYPQLAKIKILDHIDVGAVSVTANYINFTTNSPVPT